MSTVSKDLYFFPFKYSKLSIHEQIEYLDNDEYENEENIPSVCPLCHSFSGKTLTSTTIDNVCYYECDKCVLSLIDETKVGYILQPVKVTNMSFTSIKDYYDFLTCSCEIKISLDYALELWVRSSNPDNYISIMNSIDKDAIMNAEVNDVLINTILPEKYRTGYIHIGTCKIFI